MNLNAKSRHESHRSGTHQAEPPVILDSHYKHVGIQFSMPILTITLISWVGLKGMADLNLRLWEVSRFLKMILGLGLFNRLSCLATIFDAAYEFEFWTLKMRYWRPVVRPDQIYFRRRNQPHLLWQTTPHEMNNSFY